MFGLELCARERQKVIEAIPEASVSAPSAVPGGRHGERRSLEIPEKCAESRLQWAERLAPFARLPSPPGLLPPLRTPKEPMLRKATLYIAQTGNVLYCIDILGRTGRMDQTIRCCFLVPHEPEGIGTWSLHFSPRGEAKWVRGPSGRGARGRRKKARATWPVRFFTNHGLYSSPAVRHIFWSEPVLRPWFLRITSHETRITAFFRVLRPSGGEKCRLVTFTNRVFRLEVCL